MPTCAEVIAIGDEITSGQRLDTNSQWLSQRLANVGIQTLFHSTVGDDFDACVRVFREAVSRADVVVMTGGLGPTQDDLTRRALANAAGLEIEIREEAIAHIESLFARRGRTMPERNRLQAEFPVGSRIIHNPQGTAPGIDLDVPRKGKEPSRVLCFPGVPAEMKQMWSETVESRISSQKEKRRCVKHAVVKCFGLGESDMEARIPEMIARDHVPRVGITVNRATISLRISAEADSELGCNEQIAGVKALLNDRLGDLIFGEGDEFELQHCIAEMLSLRGESLCCFEAGFASEVDSYMSSLEREDIYRGGLSLTGDHCIDQWQSQTNPLRHPTSETLRAD